MQRTTRKTSRRRFLAGAAAGLTILPSVRLARAYQANERLNLAVFGTMYNAEHFLTASHIYNAAVVALCDPDRRNIAKTLVRWKENAVRMEAAENPVDRQSAERYRRMAEGEGVTMHADIRRLVDEMSDSVDALVVSHYDHLHGVACGAALRRQTGLQRAAAWTDYFRRALAPRPGRRNEASGRCIAAPVRLRDNSAGPWNWSKKARSARCARLTSGSAAAVPIETRFPRDRSRFPRN